MCSPYKSKGLSSTSALFFYILTAKNTAYLHLIFLTVSATLYDINGKTDSGSSNTQKIMEKAGNDQAKNFFLNTRHR